MSQPRVIETFQRKQLSNHIAEHVRAEILEGTRRPGEYLRLDDVAQQLGVSVTPVREAFMALSVEGFVRHAERRGFIVSTLKRRDFEDLYTMLAQVSGRLAERAAGSMASQDISQLERIHQGMIDAAAAGNDVDVERANDDFHRAINRVADSSKLAWILLSILKYVPKRLYASISGLTTMLIDQHATILEAIKNQDPKGAYQAMHDHEMLAMQEVLEDLDRRGVFEGDPQRNDDGTVR